MASYLFHNPEPWSWLLKCLISARTTKTPLASYQISKLQTALAILISSVNWKLQSTKLAEAATVNKMEHELASLFCCCYLHMPAISQLLRMLLQM
jgi:hypothetical protein